MKSRRVKLVGHVARMMGRKMHAGFRWRNMEEKPRGSYRRRYKDIIKITQKKMSW
jgi:hypothetical protein